MHFSLVFRNAFFQFISRVSTTFVGLITTLLIARHFGASGFGDFTKVTVYIGFFYLLVDFGLNAIYLKKRKKVFAELFYTRLIFSLIAFVLAILISIFLPYSESSEIGFSDFLKVGIFVFGFSIFNQGLLLSSSAIFQKRFTYQNLFISQIVGSFINLLLVIFLISNNFSLIYIFLSFVVSGFVSGLISLFLTGEKFIPKSFNIDRNLIIRSAPLGLMLIFNLLYFRADMLILSYFKTSAEVGIYGLTYRFFDFLLAIPLFLSNALYPIMLRDIKNPRKTYRIFKNYSFVFISFSLVLIAIFWFSSPLFNLIKSDFTSAIHPFRVLLLSLPLFFITSLMQWFLISFEMQKRLMFIYLFSAVLNIVLNLIFIPKEGYMAAAYITLISEFLVMISFFAILFKKNFFRMGV
ncbi:MAG: Polysaccharide biosynthesis protein, membrane-associated [Candidatus Levybacteria bacterium GW2011_GWA2_36_13]|nr:MAG: Polysaccharide biosynthesis protein, membrane-associated [Candidatus Levybacteria bacterium GW2011_GWA2_36_13]KKR15529.1 MAG: Polysaccharide biosynthesis protein, membrane-associated [Candidatus Levybacteria bacterium GW2011_GWA1_39_34]